MEAVQIVLYVDRRLQLFKHPALCRGEECAQSISIPFGHSCIVHGIIILTSHNISFQTLAYATHKNKTRNRSTGASSRCRTVPPPGGAFSCLPPFRQPTLRI